MNSITATFSTKKILTAILILAVILRIGSAIMLGDTLDPVSQARIMDQVSYNALAQSLLAGHGYSFDKYWYPFTPPNTPTAHWSFAYPVYLAAVYALTGYHPLAARILQAIISGILAGLLLYRLGKRLGGEWSGLLSAALGALYIYFIYHDAALMTESYFILGILAMLNLAVEIGQENGGTRSWVLLGLVLGVTTLLRQTVLLWLPFLLLWFIWVQRGKIPWKGFVITIGLIALFILPFTARNYLVYGKFLPLNSNAGYALYAANHPHHGTHFDQDYVAALPEDLQNQNLNEAEWSSALTARGLQFVLEDPARYLLLSWSRVGVFFNFWFSPESTLSSNLMRVLSYGVYLPFFVLGIIFSLRDWRRYSLLYLFAVIYTAMHVFTWASIRYRLPIDASMMPFAALALLTLASKLGIWSKWENRIGPVEKPAVDL